MSESDFVDVVGTALVVRPVEMYRGTIKISVTTRKSQSSLDLSLRIRDQVLEALRRVGADDSRIEDAGGHIGHSNYSGRKQVVHELKVRDPDMAVLARAMVAIENVFAGLKRGFLSGVSQDFTFTLDSPQYGRTEEALESALQRAMDDATRKASVLAERAGANIGGATTIVELADRLRPRDPERSANPGDFDAYGLCSFQLSDNSHGMEYTQVTPPTITGAIQLRVRFAMVGKDVASSS